MPKELFEIRSFNKGIALSVDPKDLSEDAASYSLNVDPISVNGKLAGIPNDVVGATSISGPVVSTTVYENGGSGSHRAVVYDANGKDVYEGPNIQNNGIPTFAIAAGGEDISTSTNPVFTTHAGKVYIGTGDDATDYPYIYEYVDGRTISNANVTWGTYGTPATSLATFTFLRDPVTLDYDYVPWNVEQGYYVNKAFRNPGYPNPNTEYPLDTVPISDNLPAVFCKAVSAKPNGTYPELAPTPSGNEYFLYYSIVYTTGEESPLNELYAINTGGTITHASVAISSNQVIEVDTLMIGFPYDPASDRKFPDNAYSIRIYVGESDTNASSKEKSITIPRLGADVVQAEITALSAIASDYTVQSFSVSGTTPTNGPGTYNIAMNGDPNAIVGTVEWSGSIWTNPILIQPIDPRYARGHTSNPGNLTFKVYFNTTIQPATVTPTDINYSFLAQGLYLSPKTGPDIASNKLIISVLGASYDANAGFSYLRNFSIVHWDLATQVNGTHIVAKTYNPELPEETLEWKRYLLKSQPYAYGSFDWANDYVILKDEPIALASYAGRVYAFGESWFQRINPDPLFIEDTYDGIGCMDKYAVLETEFGLFWASNDSIYMLDGSGMKDIGTPIKISTGSPSSYGWSEISKGRVRIGFDSKRNAVIVMSQSQELAWVYSIGEGRWDLWSIPVDMWSVCTSPEGHVIIFEGTSMSHYLQHPTNKRSFTWESGDISMGEPSYEKFFGRVYASGTADLKYKLDSGLFSAAITSPELVPQNTAGNKTIRFQVTGTGTETLDTLGVTYRRKVK